MSYSSPEHNEDFAPAQASPSPVVAASEIRFCKSSGDPWDPIWSACPRCAARKQTSVILAEAGENFRSDLTRVKSAIALYFALLAVSIITIIALTATDTEELPIRGMIAADVAMAVITVGWCVASFRDITAILTRIGSWWFYPLAMLIAVGTFGLATGIVGGLHHFLKMPVINYFDGFGEEGFGLRYAILLICIMPAVFEELAFRGVILSALEHVLTGRQAVLVSALLFAILHLSVLSIPHLVVLAVALAWLRRRSGSLYPCMVCHFTHNFLVILSEPNRSTLPW